MGHHHPLQIQRRPLALGIDVKHTVDGMSIDGRQGRAGTLDRHRLEHIEVTRDIVILTAAAPGETVCAG